MRKQKSVSKLIVIGMVLLVSAIFTWGLGVWNTAESQVWQQDSENLVWGRLLQGEQAGVLSNGGFMGRYTDTGKEKYWFMTGEEAPDENSYKVYTHQTGLQGTAFLVISQTLKAIGLSREGIQKVLLFGNSVLFVACVLFLCIWLWHEWGIWAALGGMSCVILAPWAVKSIPNLYWVVWTMLLPTVITFYWARACYMGKEGKRLLWSILLGGIVLIRFLCGFEFTSTVMLSSELPFLYYMLKDWADIEKIKQWCRLAIYVGLLELGIFVLALGVWSAQEIWWYGDVGRAVKDMFTTIGKRTGAFQNQVEIESVYAESLSVGRSTVVGNYLFSPVKLWGGLDFKKLLFVGTLINILETLSKKRNMGIKCKKWINPELILIWGSILPTVSWLFLASGHSYIHVQVNYILWLFPFIPICVSIIAKNSMGILSALCIKKEVQ